MLFLSLPSRSISDTLLTENLNCIGVFLYWSNHEFWFPPTRTTHGTVCCKVRINDGQFMESLLIRGTIRHPTARIAKVILTLYSTPFRISSLICLKSCLVSLTSASIESNILKRSHHNYRCKICWKKTLLYLCLFSSLALEQLTAYFLKLSTVSLVCHLLTTYEIS